MMSKVSDAGAIDLFNDANSLATNRDIFKSGKRAGMMGFYNPGRCELRKAFG